MLDTTRWNRALALLLPAALLTPTGCSGLGGVRDLVELYDQAAPDGLIEIELDRDGQVIEMEAEIAPDDLPANVREAAMAAMPGGMLTGAEREFNQRGRGWEVKRTVDGRAVEVVVDDAGTVLETERELMRSEAPAAVLTAAENRIQGGVFRSVERVQRGEIEEYHVKLTRDGASYKIVLDPDGTIRRAVREARGEIEIPLR